MPSPMLLLMVIIMTTMSSTIMIIVGIMPVLLMISMTVFGFRTAGPLRSAVRIQVFCVNGYAPRRLLAAVIVEQVDVGVISARRC